MEIRVFFKAKDQQQREENLKKAKEITITEDSSLPQAKVVGQIEFLHPSSFIKSFLAKNQRIKRSTW
jgi:hypothetical protein